MNILQDRLYFLSEVKKNDRELREGMELRGEVLDSGKV